MKRITLENILWSLHTMTEEVTVEERHVAPARRAVEAMIALGRSPASRPETHPA